MNEIKILRQLDHPNIVQFYEVYEMADQICIVMELILGAKLFKFIKDEQNINEEIIASIMKQLLMTLSYLETLDIIHRDIKPENILYSIDDRSQITIKLIDFGLSTFHRKKGMVRKCGTPGYTAPEILNDSIYDYKADLYSVGIIMYVW